MMVFFVLFTVGLALVLQKVITGKDLDLVEGDHRPGARVVEPDEPFSIEVLLQNNSRRFVPFLRVRERFEQEFRLHGGAGAVTCDSLGGQHVEFTAWLRPRQRLTRSIPVSVSARGRYVLSEFKLFSGDFLGLQEKMKACGRFNEIVVAPREAPAERLSEVFGGFMGDVSVNRFILEDPVLTLGYREYTGREPMKMISWAQSARGSGLMVKKSDYTLEPSVSVVLNVDTSLPEREKLLEACFSLARTVCGMLERRGVKYSFISNAVLAGETAGLNSAGEGLGPRHYRGILEHLGRATYSCRVSMDLLLERESHRQTSAGRILITPGGEDVPPRVMNRFREAAGGNLLVISAAEVAEW